jgi:hypothetical protein
MSYHYWVSYTGTNTEGKTVFGGKNIKSESLGVAPDQLDLKDLTDVTISSIIPTELLSVEAKNMPDDEQKHGQHLGFVVMFNHSNGRHDLAIANDGDVLICATPEEAQSYTDEWTIESNARVIALVDSTQTARATPAVPNMDMVMKLIEHYCLSEITVYRQKMLDVDSAVLDASQDKTVVSYNRLKAVIEVLCMVAQTADNVLEAEKSKKSLRILKYELQQALRAWSDVVNG